MSTISIDSQQELSTKTDTDLDHRDVQARSLAQLWHPSGVFEPFPDADIELSIPGRFAKIVAAYPNRPALEFETESMTFAQLNNAANVVARTLLDELGEESQPVAMLFDYGMEMIVVLLGILKAGKFYVPLSPHDPPGRWEQILSDVEPAACIADANNFESVSQLSGIDVATVLYTEFDFDQHVPAPDVNIPPDAYSYVLFTSGSTGAPKGVIGLHRNVVRFAKNLVNQFRLCPYDRSAVAQSISFSGSLAALFPSLLCGATSCLYDVHKEGLHLLPEWLANREITYFVGGAIIRAMIEFLDGSIHMPALRIIYGGAGPTYRRHFEAIKRVASDSSVFVCSLSSTEASGISRQLVRMDYEMEGEILPVGYQDDDLQVLLWDQGRQPVGDGEAGEIVVRTEFLSPGYWRQPELTAERFPDDPEFAERHVYRTGDLGRFREDGCLVHLGRIDHQVKVRGQRVEIGEVESRLLRMDGVRECVVHAKSNELGVELVAYVVGDGASPDIQRLRQLLAAGLPDYAVPQRFIVLDALPRLLTGKVDYQSLPVPGNERPELATPLTLPATPLEQQLVDIWADVLDLATVGVDDRFTDLGGDSLSAVRLLVALEKLTGRKLPFAVIAEASTVRELAAILEADYSEHKWQSLVRIQQGDDRQPLFLVPPAASTSIGFSQLAQNLGQDQTVYGFDPLGMNGEAEPQDSVEEMASLYLRELRQVQPQGPYNLGGRCFGALVAAEMAHQLEQQGEQVNLVFVIDSGLEPFQEPAPDGSSLQERWRHRRSAASPAQIVCQSLSFRARKLCRELLIFAGLASNERDEEEHMDPVFRAHLMARRTHWPQPIEARLIVIVSGEFAETGHHLGWRQVAGGEYVEHYSDHWTHLNFLKDSANLAEVSAILRTEIDRITA